MATYTQNLGIKKITPGDEDGTWGGSLNTDFDYFDVAFGWDTYDFASDANASITIGEFTASEARALFLEITDTGVVLTAGRDVTLGPGDCQKVWFVRNSTAQTITFKQGSAGASVALAAGKDAIIYTDGGGATNGDCALVYNNPVFAAITTTGAITAGGAVSGTTGTFSGLLTASASLSVTGNISVTGTVDGRDLATDGTKLDGIATSANNYSHPNHTGQVTSTGDGATVLTVSAITAQTATTTVVDTDELLINDGGQLRRIDAIDFANYVGGATSGYTHPNHTGDVTSVGDGAQTITADAVTNTKLANMATSTIKGRITGGTGDPEDLTATQVRTLINVENGATADQSDGEIETAYNNQVSVVSQAEAEAGVSTTVRRWTAERVSQAIAAQAGGAGSTNLSVTGHTGTGLTIASDTGSDATLGSATGALAGLLTASDYTKLSGIAANANNYSHPNHTGDVTSAGDGATTIASGVVTNAKLATVATSTIKGRVTAGTGAVEDLTATQARSILNVADGANNYSFTVSEITGQTALTSGLVSTDELLVNDGGVLKRMDVSVLEDYFVKLHSMPQVVFSTSKTLADSDKGTHQYHTVGTTDTLTIPANASVPFDVGTVITVILGPTSGDVTISDTNVTLYVNGGTTTADATVVAGGVASLIKAATNTWYCTGTGVS